MDQICCMMKNRDRMCGGRRGGEKGEGMGSKEGERRGNEPLIKGLLKASGKRKRVYMKVERGRGNYWEGKGDNKQVGEYENETGNNNTNMEDLNCEKKMTEKSSITNEETTQ